MDLNLRIGFSTSNNVLNPISAMVRAATSSPCSHTFLLYYHPYYKLDMVVEATETGICDDRYDWFLEKNKIVAVWTPDPKVDYGPGLEWAGKQLQKDYNYLGLIGMLPVMLARRVHKRLQNPLHEARSLFCSEMVADFLQTVKYPGTSTLTPDDMTPSDLLSFATSAGENVSWIGAKP